MRAAKAILAMMAFLLVSLVSSAAELKLASVVMPCESDSLEISPTGDQLAVYCKGPIDLLSIASGASLHTFAAEPRIYDFSFSRDGHWFAVTRADGSVEIASTSKPTDSKRFKIDGGVGSIAFLPDSSGVVVSRRDDPAQVWDIRNAPRQIATLQNDFGQLISCAFSPDGKLLVTADEDTVIRFYDTATWRVLHEYRGLTLESFTIAFTPDGKGVLVGGAENQIVVLDLSAAQVGHFDKDPGVPASIVPFGSAGEAVVDYFDAEGRAPSHRSIWNSHTGKSSALPSGHIDEARIVRGKLWLAIRENKSLEIVEYR